MPKIVNFDMILTLEDDLTQTHGTIALPGPLQWSVTSSVSLVYLHVKYDYFVN